MSFITQGFGAGQQIITQGYSSAPVIDTTGNEDNAEEPPLYVALTLSGEPRGGYALELINSSEYSLVFL